MLKTFCMPKKKYEKNWIKEIRKDKGFSVEKLANLVGVSAPYITMLENSERRIYYDVLKKIADALECHPLDITDGPANVAPPATRDERELLDAYRKLSEAEQSRILGYAEALKAAEQADKKK